MNGALANIDWLKLLNAQNYTVSQNNKVTQYLVHNFNKSGYIFVFVSLYYCDNSGMQNVLLLTGQ